MNRRGVNAGAHTPSKNCAHCAPAQGHAGGVAPASNRPQLRAADAAQTIKRPAAPPVYRPQPAPQHARANASGTSAPTRASAANRVGPTDLHAAGNNAAAPNARAAALQRKAPPALNPPHTHARPASGASVSRPNANAAHAKPHARPDARAGQSNSPRVLQRMKSKPSASIQAKSAVSRVVQAIKLYPNLHPGAVERVETDSVFKLSNFADQYRLRKTQSHGVYVPNQLYNFVRTSEGEMLLHNRYRHPSIAEGRQVLYAGEAYFNNGKLEWWSNGSGHYQPDSEDAQQAALPMDHFYSYQQIIKGEHKRRKG